AQLAVPLRARWVPPRRVLRLTHPTRGSRAQRELFATDYGLAFAPAKGVTASSPRRMAGRFDCRDVDCPAVAGLRPLSTRLSDPGVTAGTARQRRAHVGVATWRLAQRALLRS